MRRLRKLFRLAFKKVYSFFLRILFVFRWDYTLSPFREKILNIISLIKEGDENLIPEEEFEKFFPYSVNVSYYKNTSFYTEKLLIGPLALSFLDGEDGPNVIVEVRRRGKKNFHSYELLPLLSHKPLILLENNYEELKTAHKALDFISELDEFLEDPTDEYHVMEKREELDEELEKINLS